MIITCPVPVARGSSPHTRGARSAACRAVRRARIIPAYAGSTSGFRGRGAGRRDHPRIRGEHQTNPTARLGGQWIIPAYAGSTSSAPPPQTRRPDHPRIRGEHCHRFIGIHMSRGSSPHTRGARRGRHGHIRVARIIPAYAGSTERLVMSHGQRRDHPRIRGEHSPALMPIAGRSGSSPHTRGAQLADAAFGLPDRIIPAYAGSTSQATRASGAGKDHPRIRGEHSKTYANMEQESGSSPHTRGAPLDRQETQ